MTRSAIRPAALALAAALALVGAAGTAGAAQQEQAPDFTLALLDGGTLSLADLQGKPVLVNFWWSK